MSKTKNNPNWGVGQTINGSSGSNITASQLSSIFTVENYKQAEPNIGLTGCSPGIKHTLTYGLVQTGDEFNNIPVSAYILEGNINNSQILNGLKNFEFILETLTLEIFIVPKGPNGLVEPIVIGFGENQFQYLSNKDSNNFVLSLNFPLYNIFSDVAGGTDNMVWLGSTANGPDNPEPSEFFVRIKGIVVPTGISNN